MCLQLYSSHFYIRRTKIAMHGPRQFNLASFFKCNPVLLRFRYAALANFKYKMIQRPLPRIPLVEDKCIETIEFSLIISSVECRNFEVVLQMDRFDDSRHVQVVYI